ncbi:MAG: UvrD-helicase domain-containing protein, partial [Rubripirellula sp.]
MILNQIQNNLFILYVGRHDEAYKWACRKRLGQHPVTGTIQLTDIPTIELIYETPNVQHDVEEIANDQQVEEVTDNGKTVNEGFNFSECSQAYLLQLGVPAENLDQVLAVTSEGDLFKVVDILPSDVGERLLQIATGEEVKLPKPVRSLEESLASPDTRRDFHIVSEDEDVSRLLDRSFEEWMVFLHPSQRSLIERNFNGPVKVTGSAGTGKTVVAMHRAKHLAKNGKRVLLTTYSRRLTENIQARMNIFCSASELERITVATIDSIALRLISNQFRPLNDGAAEEKIIRQHHGVEDPAGFSLRFVLDEWRLIVSRYAIQTAEEYLVFERVGRGVALQQEARQVLWPVFEGALEQMKRQRRVPWGYICRWAREAIAQRGVASNYDAVIVDEIQDLGTEEIRLASALSSSENLLLVGDTGQRIYPGGFSLRSLGIEVRGRSHVLTTNYRTTLQIERVARRIRNLNVDDWDGNVENLTSTAVLNGKEPMFQSFGDWNKEDDFVVNKIIELLNEGAEPSEIAVFTRVNNQYYYLSKKLESRNIPVVRESDNPNGDTNAILCSTMHSAKGREFRFVFLPG